MSFLIHPLVLALALGAGGGVAAFYAPQVLRYNAAKAAPKLAKGARRARYQGLWLYSIIGVLAALACTFASLDAAGDPRMSVASLMLLQLISGFGGTKVLLWLLHKMFP
jgi:hypothetical protein